MGVDVDGKIMDYIHLIQVGSCENGNEYSGSIKHHRCCY
jgi:hypothetical protein